MNCRGFHENEKIYVNNAVSGMSIRGAAGAKQKYPDDFHHL